MQPTGRIVLSSTSTNTTPIEGANLDKSGIIAFAADIYSGKVEAKKKKCGRYNMKSEVKATGSERVIIELIVGVAGSYLEVTGNRGYST